MSVWKAVGHGEARAQHLNDGEKAAGDRQYIKIYNEEATNVWNDIMALLGMIVAAVELPALGVEELKTFVKGAEVA